MKRWISGLAGIILVGGMSSAGTWVALGRSVPDGYPVDGRVGSMTAEHLQRAISHLGLDARSFNYENPNEHVLRLEVDDYEGGILKKSVVIARREIGFPGKHSFMILMDTRDPKRLGLSDEFLGPTGSGESEHAFFERPQGMSWSWNDRPILRAGERAALLYVIDQGGKGVDYPLCRWINW